MPDPSPTRTVNADKQRAFQIRRKPPGKRSEEEVEWLRGYEEYQKERAVSASSRTVHVEEHQVAAAEGMGANEAIAMTLAAREEGRRLDNIMDRALGAMETACQMFHTMAADLLARQRVMEETHVAMLDSIRTHYLARVEAEGAMMGQQQGSMEEQLLGAALEAVKDRKALKGQEK